jgi:molybdate transport system ATP-binding protein
MVYVSHGLEEVLSLANRVVVMGERRVQSVLSVDELMCDPGRWGLPADALCSILEARVEERDASVGLIRVSCQGQDLWLPDGGQARGQTMLLKIDSRDVSLTLEEPGATSILNILPCVVVDGFEISPAHMGVRLQSGQLSFYALVTKRSWERLHLAKGLSLFAQLKAAVLV